MRYLITSDEMLIFRDGRPFGEVGIFGGSSLKWPFPQTLAGMARTAVGFKRDRKYFHKEENLQAILKVGIEKILPYIDMNRVPGLETDWQPLFPMPADIVLSGKGPEYHLYPLEYCSLGEKAGTDIRCRQWRIPRVNLKEKPAKKKPFFCHWDFFKEYIQEGIGDGACKKFSEIGIEPPTAETRIHNALNQANTTEEGKLFANDGFYLKTASQDDKPASRDLAIGFSLIAGDDDNIEGSAWLGGERRHVRLQPHESPYPDCPDIFDGKKILKIILSTHGDFSGWCPAWLLPDLQKEYIDFRTVPGTNFKIRLCSAVVQGWDGVSGWDYQKQKPKAMKKLVRPGSVYLVELENSSNSSDIAKHFWENTFSDDQQNNTEQSRLCGYGSCFVANTKTIENR